MAKAEEMTPGFSVPSYLSSGNYIPCSDRPTEQYRYLLDTLGIYKVLESFPFISKYKKFNFTEYRNIPSVLETNS